MGRWPRRVATGVFASPILLALAGASYQIVEARADARRFPEPGRLVDVGGYRLKLNCTGRGSPTVILESGLGDVSIEWSGVQAGIAEFSRVCSYDRAGYGGSDPGPIPRTSAHIAQELHALLTNAGESPPYLLVGHSFGGYNVRVFSGQHQEGVAGMVLVDAPQEDQYRLLPAVWKGISAALSQHFKTQARWAPLLIGLGVARAQLHLQGADQDSYLYLQSKYLEARASELEEIQVSAEQARASGTLDDKALVVLTAAKSFDALRGRGLSEQDFRNTQRLWVDDLQMRLVRLSTRGKRIVVDAGHNIPLEKPGAVVDAVREVCSESRPSAQAAPRPADPQTKRTP